MATIGSVRRYYLHRRIRAVSEESDMALIWRSKQEAEPGTALPASFPLLSRLTECGYTTTEDLDGADDEELIELGFSSREAKEILSAFAEL